MADITQIFSQFKTERELKQFCEAQYKTILELSNKLKLSEETNKNLQDMLVKSNPLVVGKKDQLADEEAVCITQIALLKVTSQSRELTLEEAKKLDIYNKILQGLRSGKKNSELDKLKNLGDEDLMKALDDGKP